VTVVVEAETVTIKVLVRLPKVAVMLKEPTAETFRPRHKVPKHGLAVNAATVVLDDV
jgi:hypothetical protein